MKIIATLTLLTACVWLVGNLVLGALVAPSLFAHAPVDLSRAQAGHLFGDILARWIELVDLSLWLALIVLLSLCAGYLLKIRRWLLMIATFIMIIGLSGVHLWARSTMREAHDQSSSVLAQTSVQVLPDEQHEAFARLHRLSEMLFATETALLALLVLGSAVIVMVHRPDAPEASD